ncbi:MAG: hypothetical protein AAF483_30930, partial [Planctomycetota bacterium]
VSPKDLQTQFHCDACGEALNVLELSSNYEPCDEIPSGCRVESCPGGVNILVSRWSLTDFILLSVFALIWNSFVWAILIAMLWGIASTLENPDAEASGFIVMLVLLLGILPFVLAGIWMIVMLLSYLFGRTEVLITRQECSITRRLFSWRSRKKFDPQFVRGVSYTSGGEGSDYLILFETEQRTGVQLAKELPKDRMIWLRATLAELFTPTPSEETKTHYPELSWLQDVLPQRPPAQPPRVTSLEPPRV